jgi:PAS domain S-box-containing protein
MTNGNVIFSWRKVEWLGLILAAVALGSFQTTFPITLGPVWLLAAPYGLALVAVILCGYWGVLALGIGSGIVWVMRGAVPEEGIAHLVLAVEATVLRVLLTRRLPFSSGLEHPRDVLLFTTLIAIGSLIRAVFTMVGSMALGAGASPAACLGGAAIEWFATLLIAPVCLVWLRGPALDRTHSHRIAEGLVLAGITIGLTWFWFGGENPQPHNHPVPMLAAMLGIGNWIAFRFYVRGMVSFIFVVGGMFALGAAQRGTFAPLIPLEAPALEQILWMLGMGVVAAFHFVIASVAKDYAVREREGHLLMTAVRKHAERLGDVNSRLSLQALEIADQADELQRQRDEFERLATELSEKQARLGLFESAVVNAQDAIIILEATSQPGRGRAVLYVNAAFTRITGYAADEVLGRSLHVLRGDKTDPETLAAMREALDEHRPFNCELLNYRRDGEGVWVSLSLVPVFNAAGDCRHFVMIQRDITDRKRAEEAIHASEAKFRGIFETAAAGVSLTDADGRFTACNPAFAAILGRPVEEILGRLPSEFTHPDDWAAQRELQRDLIEGRLSTYQYRKRYVRPDGSTLWTELSLAAIRDGSGRYDSGLGVSVDISARLNLEDQLRQAQKMEALGQLAGGVAHDFNNLLTAVLGNLALVKLEDDNPAAPLLKTVERAASRAADLTRKLLGYARRNQLLVSPTLPGTLIGEVVDILRRTIDPRIEIRTDIRTDESVAVDSTLMNQALFNLCLNARDAMPHGGVLTIAAERCDIIADEANNNPDARPGRYVRFLVADTGGGMDETVKQRLFEPFFTTKGVGRGTGLGLPMVHGILKQHGGWVTFESELGRGTQFHMYLPLLEDPAALPPSRFGGSATCDTDTPAPQPAKTSTVLLVDDEEMIRVLGRTILETNGYRVLEATDGMEAVETFAAHDHAIDLVILDVTMPRLSGRDAIGQILARKPGARVLFSSGYSTEDLSEIEGSIGMLTKPYRPKDLLGAVHRALRNLPVAVTTSEA